MKKSIRCPANLQELPLKVRKALFHKLEDRMEQDLFREDALLPMIYVAPGYELHLMDADRGIMERDCITVCPILNGQDNLDLVSECYPGIRDHGGKEDCMSAAAHRAPDPAYPDLYRSFRAGDASLVEGMDRQASRMAAGTLQKMEL